MIGKYLFTISLTLAIVGVTTAQTGSKAVDEPSVQNQFQRLNSYSRAANDKKDDKSTKTFTDSVIEMLVPASTASDVLKKRLFALEKQHRATNDVGITEASLARSMNSLAKRIGAPAFAQTSALQIRVFRARLHFMGLNDVVAPGLSQKAGRQSLNSDAVLASVPNDIGPAEASLVIGTILRSRLTSEEMQVSPDEWKKAFLAKKERARQNNVSGANSQDASTRTYSLVGVGMTPNAIALQTSLHNYMQSMGSADTMNQELDTFIEEIRHE
jgi:hypothetical protein